MDVTTSNQILRVFALASYFPLRFPFIVPIVRCYKSGYKDLVDIFHCICSHPHGTEQCELSAHGDPPVATSAL